MRDHNINSDDLAQWLRFLNPEEMKSGLQFCSLYIAIFEMLKESIVGRPRDMYTHTFTDGEWIPDPDYAEKVLKRDKNKNALWASLDWLKEYDILSEADIRLFKEARNIRNNMAHDMIKALLEMDAKITADIFNQMLSLVHKIEHWWVVNVEIATDPDLYDKDIDLDGVVPGKMMTIRILIDVTLGEAEKAWEYYNAMKEQIDQHRSAH